MPNSDSSEDEDKKDKDVSPSPLSCKQYYGYYI